MAVANPQEVSGVMKSTRSLFTAVERPESGLSTLGFTRRGTGLFVREVSDDVHWRLVVFREPDEPQWQGRIWVGVSVPALRAMGMHDEPRSDDPGMHWLNLLGLAGRDDRFDDWNYNGAAPNRWRLLNRLSDEELEERAARDLGAMVREAALPWWESQSDVRGVAAAVDADAAMVGPGPDVGLWVNAGLLWKLAGDDEAAAEAWKPRAHFDREELAYLQELRDRFLGGH